jgi:hypothetical protein
MSDAQTIKVLDPETQRDLDSKRQWMIGHFETNAAQNYHTAMGKIDLLATILANQWIDPYDGLQLQCLGVTLGDAIAQDTLMEWVTVDDDYGTTAALNWPGTSLLCFPLTLISKRLEDRETVDVHDLFEMLCERLKFLAFSGQHV